jgi:hypothetical protein
MLPVAGAGFKMASDSSAFSLTLSGSSADTHLYLGTSQIVGNSGNVGIGTTSPVSKLHVLGNSYNHLELESASGNVAITFDVETSNTNYYDWRIDAQGTVANALCFGHSTAAGNQTFNAANMVMTMLSSGNVGIGVTDPEEKLEVDGHILLKNNKYLKVESSSGGNYRLIGLDNNNDIYMGAIDNAGGSVHIREDGSNVLSFTATNATFAGNVYSSGTITCNGDLTTDEGTLKIEPKRESTRKIIQLGHGAAGSGTGDAQPYDVVSIRGHSIDYSGGTRLTNTGFLHWHTVGNWTGGERQWALTNGYNMGVSPRFTLLYGNAHSVFPSLGENGGLGTNTNMACYWANDGSFYQNGNATFAGDVLPSADNSKDLGSASYRWANIYSADLQLSNEGTGGNEIDGTEGSWTIQEGEEDLYLLNRKNGKKYKFMLQEIE